MSVPVWVADLAEQFWMMAGEPPRYPRCLIVPATSSLMLSVVELPALNAETIARWLGSRAVHGFRSYPDRPLHGCLVARDGAGFVFLNADDPTDERRFSFAHELAHFLRDYWRPRCNAVARFGEHIIDVLDGKREPTPSERLAELLRGCQLKTHVHLMDRDGERLSSLVAVVERDADRLAFELLAPAHVVQEGSPTREDIERVLVSRYGLPAMSARSYARILIPEEPRDPLFERLRAMKG